MTLPTLEKRVCKCGCKRTWRCLPGSKSEYFSNWECREPEQGVQRLEFGDQRPRGERKQNRRIPSKWDRFRAKSQTR